MRTPAGAPHVRIFPDAETLAHAAAQLFVETAAESRAARGRFTVALAGGTTPRRVYELLAGDEFRERIDWHGCHVFFGDERCVPPDDADSNYRMANESLLARVPLPAENVHRISGEGDAVANARLYEDELREFFGATAWPEFDLVLLGMGEDGHTASLFPHTPALEERAAWVTANWVERLGAYRITLTAPAINRARSVLFMVAGASKAGALRAVIGGESDERTLPARLIRSVDGALHWYVDEAAAGKL
jgi:6-phosphogluconolactonase